KQLTQQGTGIKNRGTRSMNGSARAIASLFKLVREHRLNLNDDRDVIHFLAERLDFVEELFDESGTSPMISGLSVEQKERFTEEFFEHGVPYLTGKLRLAPDHPLSLKPRRKMRPSTAIAEDLLCELRERITIMEGRTKF